MSQPKKPGNRKTAHGVIREPEELREIDRSCRTALLAIFLLAGLWLVVGAAFSLISSIKFHSPSFLADSAWLTYGRTRPAFFNALLYGFCIPAALGCGLWVFARLGRTQLSLGWLAVIGAFCWNVGVAAGIFGILRGDATGHQYVEMPLYAAPMLFSGYVLIGLSAAVTFHHRAERPLYVSQWLILAALLWFPWIFSTAQLLLSVFPSRGIVQSIIAWWYARNLLGVWLVLFGLGLLFYYVPKILGRDLHSRHLALFTFWTLILFAPWGGIPVTAPVPAWMPVLSTVTTLTTLVPLLAVGLILSQTTRGMVGKLWRDPVGRFLMAGSFFLLATWVMQLVVAVPRWGAVLGLSWFTYAHALFALQGFFVLTLLGAAYYILPRIAGIQIAPPMRLSFLLFFGGTLVTGAPLMLAGLAETARFGNKQLAFMDIVQSTLMYLRLSTMGELLLLAGSVMFLLFVGSIIYRLARAEVTRTYTEATRDLFQATGAKS